MFTTMGCTIVLLDTAIAVRVSDPASTPDSVAMHGQGVHSMMSTMGISIDDLSGTSENTSATSRVCSPVTFMLASVMCSTQECGDGLAYGTILNGVKVFSSDLHVATTYSPEMPRHWTDAMCVFGGLW